MTTMIQDGYVAAIEFDKAAGLFHGEVVNTHAVLTFQARTADALGAAFAETITDYAEWCASREQTPDRPTANS
jgi:predicted HicB family RNase H-like nuclease